VYVRKIVRVNKVLIIGLGELGLPVAKYVKEKGFDGVYGYDINPKAMDRAEKTAGIKIASDFREFDVYILSISTHKPDDIFSPQVEALLSIVERISKEAKSGALVSIESTIPKGTSKKVFEMLNHRLHVAHAPHRWYALEENEHGINQPRVVGGVCDCCLEAAMQFYDGRTSLPSFYSIPTSFSPSSATSLSYSSYKSLGIRMHPVSKVEIAEITKIAENAHRYLQIAFAEDLYLYCHANKINFPELRNALNTKWNVNILEPREGILGHCLPKDTKMFIQAGKSKILTAAMELDQDYQKCRQPPGSSKKFVKKLYRSRNLSRKDKITSDKLLS
jgi:UDP-N-acetyl-D-mannosaminuronic acid dehydrogenase